MAHQVIDSFYGPGIDHVRVYESSLTDGSPVFDVRFTGHDDNYDLVVISIDCFDQKLAQKLAAALAEGALRIGVTQAAA
jgi:hypothetical protein